MINYSKILLKIIVNILVFIFLFIQNGIAQKNNFVYLVNEENKIEIDPATFAIKIITAGNDALSVSTPTEKKRFSNLKYNSHNASWNYDENHFFISCSLIDNYIDVNISATDSSRFTWPNILGEYEALTIPWHEGKFIPSNDKIFINFLSEHGPLSGLQDLSMQFFAVNYKTKALVYVIKNKFNNNLFFYNHNDKLALNFEHQFPATVKNKQFGFRIYTTKNDPVSIAKTYLNFIKENNKIITLEQKAAYNPNIRKLYGAPHIYIWNADFLLADDVTNWKLLKENIISQLASHDINPTKYIFSLFKSGEYGKQFLKQLDEFKKSEWTSDYQKNLLVRSWNEALKKEDVYNAAAWKNFTLNEEAKTLINKAIENKLIASNLYRLNALLLFNSYPDCLSPLDDWGGAPLWLLDSLKFSGIKRAWLGLGDDWIQGEVHNDFSHKAIKDSFLIGPYDSYHSMHPPGKEKWFTAKFNDTSLYHSASITNENGSISTGFLGFGRHLNPTLLLPAIKDRVTSVMMDMNNNFNSWFIDCDATGECFDDYTPNRITSQQEDLEARLSRMSWIRDSFNLVIGSEDGNDFAANIIAFGHGMVTPVVDWGDPDLRKNELSPYFLGGYFSKDGSIPPRYVKPVPLKEKDRYIYFDERFNVPLFQLVYNNVEITTHHWEWNSLKVPSEIHNREIKEILYNVPPLYHINKKYWLANKKEIIKQVLVFTKTHPIAIKEEMTAFEWLNNDRLVQRVQFGNMLEILANYTNVNFRYHNKNIPAKGLLIHYLNTNEYVEYIP